ncbi:MAG: hypothetical protein LQ338_001742 [Usnochroma carphineum]|nr:MAG: hypothetical protein LQ338_001742 [Usnochroma carphineum]
MASNTEQQKSGHTTTTTTSGPAPLNPKAQPFIPFNPAATTPQPQPQPANPPSTDHPDDDIPSPDIATQFSKAFAAATRGMRFQTLEQSRFAPRAAAASSTRAAASSSSSSTRAFPLASSTHPPPPPPAPAIPEDQGARAFRERMARRGIRLADPRETKGEEVDSAAYASLDLFERMFAFEEEKVKVEETKVLVEEEKKEVKKEKEKGGGLATKLDMSGSGYKGFLERYGRK